MKKICVMCSNFKGRTLICNCKCNRPDKRTGVPVERTLDYERSFNPFSDNCGIRGKYFSPLYPKPKLDYKKFEALALFLHEKIHAFRYYNNIGFENGLGDFEINEDLWDKYIEEINEFETLADQYISESNTDIIIIRMYEKFEITGYKKVIG